jgi:hypothetical protein
MSFKRFLAFFSSLAVSSADFAPPSALKVLSSSIFFYLFHGFLELKPIPVYHLVDSLMKMRAKTLLRIKSISLSMTAAGVAAGEA